MPETYIDIMLQSMKKKEKVLDEIIRVNDRQKDCLTLSNRPVEEFEQTVDTKSACIKQLEQLDSGFEKLYAQVAEELDKNRSAYAEQIEQLQKRIRNVTEKSVRIQAQEARNKDLMQKKFQRVKQQAVSVRSNSRAIQGYYNSMKKW
jgi:flagellar biosynthesis/type III secretory pathway chaperone